MLSLVALASCNHQPEKIVSEKYIDSLISNYQLSPVAVTNKGDLEFWEKRMQQMPDNFVNGPKYASALALRFHLFGDIHDLLKADSLLKEANIANNEKEDGILYSLSNFAMQRHRFKEANEWVDKAVKAGDNKYGGKMMLFDAVFEMGEYNAAGNILNTTKPYDTYPAYFRRAKYEHYKGSLDSSIVYMMKAAEKAAGNKYLEQAAISNAADLNIHKGDLLQAYDLYKKSIAIDGTDFHSIMGIGWIAMMNDKNDSLAKKIFDFVQHQIASPDPLLKLMYIAEFKGDSIQQKKYAEAFAEQTDKPVYGLMYNKYLIQLYTGILNNPSKALELAMKEIENRATPQTYAWYAWALLNANQNEKAYEIYDHHISGKPLEGLELYYMAKLMHSMHKEYNAQQFYKAAWQNRYDLSPSQVNDIEKNLE
ncbi:MAG: hypothetical protein QM802_14400 [Agriterribacter sp.]